MKLYTTFRILQDEGACTDRYNHLINALGEGYGENTPVYLTKIFEVCDKYDTVWVLRNALPPKQRKIGQQINRDMFLTHHFKWSDPDFLPYLIAVIEKDYDIKGN